MKATREESHIEENRVERWRARVPNKVQLGFISRFFFSVLKTNKFSIFVYTTFVLDFFPTCNQMSFS
jgi:hypothetical protein